MKNGTCTNNLLKNFVDKREKKMKKVGGGCSHGFGTQGPYGSN